MILPSNRKLSGLIWAQNEVFCYFIELGSPGWSGILYLGMMPWYYWSTFSPCQTFPPLPRLSPPHHHRKFPLSPNPCGKLCNALFQKKCSEMSENEQNCLTTISRDHIDGHNIIRCFNPWRAIYIHVVKLMCLALHRGAYSYWFFL